MRQLISRVADTITGWGMAGGYFASAEDGETFRAELTHLLVNQKTCFNSPVWFNVGIEPEPQCSACFINSVKDTMQSILELAKTEGMLFKYGSGTGSNLSPIRSSRELLDGGGTASGPVSFMRGFDAFAGVIKSGGKTRRAAKMVILDVDHPDIVDFIRCKELEEKKAWALIDAGFEGGFNVAGGAYDSIAYQNANHSVRVTDEFMAAVIEDEDWTTHAIIDGHAMDTHRARDLMRMMAESAWVCGDPGIQFDTTINDWHTCANTDRINASNPCSEYMFLDDSACNLASLNLMRFYDEADGGFDVPAFRHACEVMITAMEIIVGNASYPTPRIAENSERFRPLGLGYANLGALLMARGIPYDSDAGRDYAAAITALMSGAAYAQSARIAETDRAVRRLRDQPRADAARHAQAPRGAQGARSGLRAARPAAGRARVVGRGDRARRAVRPPQRPDLGAGADRHHRVHDGLRHHRRRARHRAGQVQEAGRRRRHQDRQQDGAARAAAPRLRQGPGAAHRRAHRRAGHHRGRRRPAERAPAGVRLRVPPGQRLALDPLPRPPQDAGRHPAVHLGRDLEDHQHARDLDGRGHRRRLPRGLEAGPEGDRDLPRRLQAQPAAVDPSRGRAARRVARRPLVAPLAPAAQPVRRVKLPDERRAITHKFSVNGHEGYITVGLYDNGQPGEIFLTMAKQGSTVSGLVDAFATGISIALQYGVPLRTLVDKFSHTRFEPSGFTTNPEIPIAKSITDYIFRWLASKFLSTDEQRQVGVILRDLPPEAEMHPVSVPAPAAPRPVAVAAPGAGEDRKITFLNSQDAPSCHACGSIMVRNGSCYKCLDCGETSGCS